MTSSKYDLCNTSTYRYLDCKGCQNVRPRAADVAPDVRPGTADVAPNVRPGTAELTTATDTRSATEARPGPALGVVGARPICRLC